MAMALSQLQYSDNAMANVLHDMAAPDTIPGAACINSAEWYCLQCIPAVAHASGISP